ncbi:MAG TPA: hypothetical protein VMO47_00180 [Rhodothermales bacterium]|nr:hypothetical protein [Rhodothermales bacterium]
MRCQVIYAVLLLSTLLGPVSAMAQAVPADTARVILGVAETLRARGEIEESERLLRLIRRLYPDTEAARLASEALVESRQTGEIGSGNTELIVFNTFYGAALGVIIPAALGAEDPEPYGAGILLGAPAGYGLSRLYTRKYPVTTGQARAMTFGTWWGALQVLGWREVLDIGETTETVCFDPPDNMQCFEATSESDEAPYAAMLVGGLSGLALGTIIGRSVPIEGSTALIANFSGIWGSWFGSVLGVQIDGDSSNDFETNDDDDDFLTTILVVGNVGLLAGALGGSSLGWSTADAWTVHLSGIAGIIGGFGIDLLASVEDTETVMLIPGITSAAALGVAAALVSNDRTTSSADRGPRVSMIDFADGKWSAGIPTPVPTIIPTYRDGQKLYQPAGKVSIVRMRW